jgi:hypothetical protein
MSIIKQFIKDSPIYLNGFCVGWLTFGREYNTIDVILFVIAGLTFLFFKNDKK